MGSTVTETTGNGEGPAGFGLRSTWGVVSVLYILVNAIKRLAPIALQPFSRVSSGLLLNSGRAEMVEWTLADFMTERLSARDA